MIETLVVGVALALLQFALHRATAKRFAEIEDNTWQARAHANDAAASAASADGNAAMAVKLLEPAVAQLPKTRAKKPGKPDEGMSAAGPEAQA